MTGLLLLCQRHLKKFQSCDCFHLRLSQLLRCLFQPNVSVASLAQWVILCTPWLKVSETCGVVIGEGVEGGWVFAGSGKRLFQCLPCRVLFQKT